MPFFGLFGNKSIAERVGLPKSVGRDLIEWVSLDDRAACRFLETHLEIVRPETLEAMTLMIEQMNTSPETQVFARDLRRKRLLLQTVLAHGISPQVVRDLYRAMLGD
jgi:hypothetical protein